MKIPYSWVNRVAWSVEVVTLFAAMAGLWWVTKPYGPATLPDSASYLASAASLAAGGGVIAYDGSAIGFWPPLYAAVLALVMWSTRLEMLDAARLLGMLLLGGTLVQVMRMVRLIIPRGWFGYYAFILCASSTTLFLMAASALSEGLFIFCVTSLLFTWLRTPTITSIRTLVLLSVWCSLAMMTRYIGVACVFLVGLGLVEAWCRSRVSFGQFMVRLIILGGSFLPLALWMMRNFFLVGSLSGSRVPPAYQVPQAVYQVLDVATQFLFPAIMPLWLRLALVLAVLVLAMLHYFRNSRLAPPEGRPVGLLAAWSAVYTLVLIVLATRTYVDVLDFRLLSPCVIPVVILFSAGLSVIGTSMARPAGPLVALVLGALVLGLSLQRLANLVVRGHAAGLGLYTQAAWQNDRLVQVLRTIPNGERIASNAADALYVNSGRQVELLPLVGKDARQAWDVFLSQRTGSVWVIWYEDFWRQYTVGPDQAEGLRTMERVVQAEHGSIYLIHAPPNPP